MPSSCFELFGTDGWRKQVSDVRNDDEYVVTVVIPRVAVFRITIWTDGLFRGSQSLPVEAYTGRFEASWNYTTTHTCPYERGGIIPKPT